MPPVLQKTIRNIHQRLRALETREYAEVVGPGSVINAQYLTLALHAILTAERRFVAGDGLVGTDAGANADYTLDVDLVAAWSGLEFAAGELRVDEDAVFLWTGAHTFNVNIAMAGGVTIDGMDPSAHTADGDAHHNEVHVVNSTGPHAEAGLTIGHVLRASGVAAFSFAALQAGDIPGLGGVPALTLGIANAAGAAATYIQTDASIAVFDAVVPGTIQCDDAANTGAAAFAARRDHQHAIVCDVPVDIANANAEGILTYFSRSDHVHNHPAGLGVNLHHTQAHDIVGGDHMVTGAAWNVVGCTAVDAIGLLLARDDVTAPVESILKSTAAGDLTLHDLTATGQLSAGAGAAEGIILGADAQWYRSAANIMRTPDSVTIDVGLNVGTTGAGAGQILTETAGANIIYVKSTGSWVAIGADGAAGQDAYFYLRENGTTQFTIMHDASVSQFQIRDGTSIGTVVLRIDDGVNAIDILGGLNVGTATAATAAGQAALSSDLIMEGAIGVIRTNTADGSDDKGVTLASGGVAGTARGAYFSAYGNENALTGNIYVTAGEAGDLYLRTGVGAANQTVMDAAGDVTMPGTLTVVGCVAHGSCEIYTEDALAIIRDITTSHTDVYDEYGHERYDMAKLYQKYPYLIHKQEWPTDDEKTKTRYFDRVGAQADLTYRAVMQLDDHRIKANAEREAIREQIGILKNRLAILEAA